jgi:valyl-tRNA synthetase
VHRQPWPEPSELSVDGDAALLPAVSTVLAAVRGAKSAAKVSMRTEVASAHVRGPAERLALAQLADADLRAAGHVTGDLSFSPSDDAGGGGEVSLDVVLAG